MEDLIVTQDLADSQADRSGLQRNSAFGYFEILVCRQIKGGGLLQDREVFYTNSVLDDMVALIREYRGTGCAMQLH